MGKKANGRQKHRRLHRHLSEEQVLARLEMEPLKEGLVVQHLDPEEDPYVDPTYLAYLRARSRHTKHRKTR